jgi:hypothetical protein
MNKYTSKISENTAQSAGNIVVQKKSMTHSPFQLTDNRPKSIAQSKLQETMSNHAPIQQLADNRLSKTTQLKKIIDSTPVQKKANHTGLPDHLKTNIENLSGLNMDDVKVHYNSAQPAQLQAHAFAKGTSIHLAPGQEKHLPHEAWHVVQQKQGRVKPTLQMKGTTPINDDSGLEQEADKMGMIASNQRVVQAKGKNSSYKETSILQLKTVITHKTGEATFKGVKGKVGLEMDANLDPSEPVLGSGTDPAIDGESANLYAKVATDNPGSFARGHLLNHDLGGFGVIDNLYPISAGANARHSLLAEQKVKRALIEAATINHNNKNNLLHVVYQVRVLGTPAHSQFACKWFLRNSYDNSVSNSQTAVIESKLNDTDPYQPAGHEIGLIAWSHGTRKGMKGTPELSTYNHNKNIISTHNGAAGHLLGAAHITVQSAAEKKAQRAWALAHPKELSAEDKLYWTAYDNRLALQKAEQDKLLAQPQMSTRSATKKKDPDEHMSDE